MNNKLLQINVSANWGSHGKIAEGIGEIAISNGWESYIAFGRFANASQSKLIKIGNEWDHRLHGLATRLFDRHGLASAKATTELVKSIEKINPDIIHLHNVHGYYLNYPVLFKYLSQSGIPVVWTLHDCWAYTGHCPYPIFAGCSRWMSHCVPPCPLRKSFLKSWIVDNCRKNFDIKKQCFNSIENLYIVTVSKWLEIEVKKSFLRNKNIRCIYNGVDISIFKPTEYGMLLMKHKIKKTEKVVLGVASIWEERKGLYYFYRLRQLLPSTIRIILIGLSAKQIENLPSGIDGVSRTDSQQELAAYYSMADVYVNPSQAETFGMTTAEAMACGTPAIVYDVTASPELIDGKTGRAVMLGDVKALGNTIIEICDKPLSPESCRERVIQFFNKDKRYQDYMKLYEEILNSKI